MDHFYGIYGLGAVIIILFSQYFNKNNFTLFLGGCIIGSIAEYLISFLVEIILHTKWWDYSNNILNINGRICLLYSIFWGLLTLFLIKNFNPFLDMILSKLESKLSSKVYKGILSIIIIFLILNCMATCYAQDIFITKMVVSNNIQTKDLEQRKKEYEVIAENEYLTNFINKYWNDKKMIKTFPNMKIEDEKGNIIYLDGLLPEIQPYYLKIFDK